MSDNNIEETTETNVEPDVDETVVLTEPDEESTEGSESDSEPQPQSRREARYRTQLRAAESQRDQLASTVEAMQRAEAERLAANTIAQPAALWAAGTQLADLIGDDGLVDPTRVAEAAKTARENLGLAPTQRGPHVAREGTSVHETSPPNTWEDAFRAK